MPSPIHCPTNIQKRARELQKKYSEAGRHIPMYEAVAEIVAEDKARRTIKDLQRVNDEVLRRIIGV